jgi:hypothetical protein
LRQILGGISFSRLMDVFVKRKRAHLIVENRPTWGIKRSAVIIENGPT